MLRYRDFVSDLNEVKDKGDKVTIQDVVKIQSLLGKMLRDIRYNQIAMMKKAGVELSKPEVRTDKETTTEDTKKDE